jgi:Cu-processing system permease protein
MSDILAIAHNTFKRTARMKALYIILVICCLDVAAMGLYKDLSMGREKTMMFDAALAISLLVGAITAVGGAFELQRELNEQTAQLVLTKPLGRSHFVIGKFLGVAGLCIFNVAFICAGSALAIKLRYGEVDPGLYIGCAHAAGEAVMLASVAMLFSLLMRDALAAFAVFLVFLVGHGIAVLPLLFDGESGLHQAMRQVSNGLLTILPNFRNLNFRSELAQGLDVGREILGYGVAYAVTYAVGVLGVAAAIFERQDIGSREGASW